MSVEKDMKRKANPVFQDAVKDAAAPGDSVKVITPKEQVEGILMPSPHKDIVMIKLNTGYNLGFEKKDVKEIQLVEREVLKQKTSLLMSKDEKLPTIVVLHTGGTIASKVDYTTGAVTAKFTAEDLLEKFPKIGKITNVHTELISNLMSEDIRFSDYQTIARAVKKYALEGVSGKKVKGIIIGHGTDTLSYTAAALSFMFERINLPVILVGSQRSPDRGSTDAALNLTCAAKFIAETDFVGVAVCMHHSSNDDDCAILPATKVRKMHTSRRDSFKAINSTAIALVKPVGIEYLWKDYPKGTTGKGLGSKEAVILRDKFEEKVGWLKVHPNMDPELFRFFTSHYRAIMIEGTGLGHAPTNLGEKNLQNYAYLQSFLAKGGIVAITSQCLFGRVHPSVYTNLRRLSEIGSIYCEDMLPETAYIKLSWLLGNYPPEESKKMMVQNLRGEISEQSAYTDDFLKE